jgi:biopolymer transport protein ExbD
MAPMIDMIFLLLIFFLATAKFRPDEALLPLQLAAGNESTTPVTEPLAVRIEQAADGCRILVGGRPVTIANDTAEQDLGTLLETFQNTLASQKRLAADPVEVACEPDVKWEHIARVYNVFFGMGLTDITFRLTDDRQPGEQQP